MNLVDTPLIKVVVKDLKRRVAQGEDLDELLKNADSFDDKLKEDIKKAVKA